MNLDLWFGSAKILYYVLLVTNNIIGILAEESSVFDKLYYLFGVFFAISFRVLDENEKVLANDRDMWGDVLGAKGQASVQHSKYKYLHHWQKWCLLIICSAHYLIVYAP